MDASLEYPSKHFGVDRRHKRFDTSSKYGGRCGHTLVRARPRADIGRSIPGYADAYLSEQVVQRVHGRSVAAFVDCLEESCLAKVVEKDPRCPDVLITKYKMEAGDSDAASSRVYSLSSFCSTAANVRRFPRGFDFCHMGCSRCTRDKGICGNPKNSTKARRLRFHEEVAQDILRSLDSEDAIFGKVQPDVDHMMLEVVAAPLFSEASLEEKVSTPTSIISHADSSDDSWTLASLPAFALDAWVEV